MDNDSTARNGTADNGLEEGKQEPSTDDADGVAVNSKNHVEAQTTQDTIALEAGSAAAPPDLDPPLSSGEKMRDALLRLLDGTCFQYLGIAVLIGVVASGAMFFFFLMGWQTLCRPRTDCQPRNDIYNISVQILNGFFTYMATVSMPWRCVNFLHTTGWSCPYRENAPGHDLYGQATDDVWFHVPLRKRLWVIVILLLNCLTQYANQVTRIIYWNYDLQNEFPGNMWVNIFFGSSMICAAIGGSLMAYHTGKIRATDPERFGLGPIDLARDMWRQMRQKPSTEDTAIQSGGGGDEEEGEKKASPQPPNSGNSLMSQRSRRASEAASAFDPTRAPQRRSVIDVNRSSMRMFAL